MTTKQIVDVAKELRPKLTELSKAVTELSKQQQEVQELIAKANDLLVLVDESVNNITTLGAVTGLEAFDVKTSSMQVKWNPVQGAERYLIDWGFGRSKVVLDGTNTSIPFLTKSSNYVVSVHAVAGNKEGPKASITVRTPANDVPTPTTPAIRKTDRSTGVPVPMIGMNGAGLEFGSNIPGRFNTDYFSPRDENFRRMAERGIKLIRLPFKWERVQRDLFGPLHAPDLKYIQDCISLCEKYGMLCIPDMHNYMRRRVDGATRLIGSPEVPSAALADFWLKFSEVFKGNKTVFGHNIMNEPYPKQPTWAGIAKETYHAIRQVDKEIFVIIDGAHWANAEGWESKNEGIPWFGDEYYRIIWDAHCYFDIDASGSYKDREEHIGKTLEDHFNIGVKRVTDFFNWCEKHDQMGMILEFSAPHDAGRKIDGVPAAWTAMERFLQLCIKKKVPVAYFAAGPNWTASAVNGIEIKGELREPIAILEKYGKMNLTTTEIGPL